MTKKLLFFCASLCFFVLGMLFVLPVRAEDKNDDTSHLDTLPTRQREYESAKRAAETSPKNIEARKRVLTSYIAVAEIRLASMDALVRKLDTTTNDSFLITIMDDRAELANIAEALTASRTTKDLTNITERIKHLRVFSDRAITRSQVLATHRSILITKGIDVLEARIAQIRHAMDILAKEGKDISALEVMFTSTHQHIEDTKQRITQLTNDRINDPTRYEENKTELISIEGEIRNIYKEFDALSQKGILLRDTK